MLIVIGVFGWLKNRLSRSNNKLPRYVITENGIHREMIDPEDSDLPLDSATYKDHQIFVGDFANPVEIDISDIDNTISGKDMIPSEKYKIFMGQTALKQMFQSEGFNQKKILWLLFISVGLNILGLIAVIMTGVA